MQLVIASISSKINKSQRVFNLISFEGEIHFQDEVEEKKFPSQIKPGLNHKKSSHLTQNVSGSLCSLFESE